ncbi:hypothetical protein KL86PLE_20169 [uncultured Pleomorphomonas sp.]|uniref:Uncharacterized protein n=1 Tax=uncultured Pleomorphomonas sp. TaxID=442121 RepID=A0A212LD81_9HYPH|nr:hypothetical protein KL86PLE_20169 [uncultured Pleomorphomonas sp.]
MARVYSGMTFFPEPTNQTQHSKTTGETPGGPEDHHARSSHRTLLGRDPRPHAGEGRRRSQGPGDERSGGRRPHL